ncbi:MAG: hypothetical protein KFB97_11620 [Cyanobium sp. M30B3]|nr:MAG: hypothetical protein KFB97_11620 [Cyanobium sp. M30B3]
MTFSTAAGAGGDHSAPPALVLLSAGPVACLAALQQQAAPVLAEVLRLPLRTPLDPLAPDAALAALAEGPSGLAPLPRDPGLALADGRHWAAALGAWRQPVLLLLAAEQLETGLPAALTALLRQWQVPCLGLVQWGGPWQPEQRRREGLPWLGALESSRRWPGSRVAADVGVAGAADAAMEADAERATALRFTCQARWQDLRHQLYT